jgi:hypothetical protein
MGKPYLFAPDGSYAYELLLTTMSYGTVTLDSDGAIFKVDDPEHDSHEFRRVDTLAGYVLHSTAGNEHLERFCRVIHVDDGCDPWDVDIPPWPVEILALCARAVQLAISLWHIDRLKVEFPKDFADTTITTVLDAVITGRIEAELKSIDEQVKAFRATREEPTGYGFIDCGRCDANGCEFCGNGLTEGVIYG